MKIHAFSRIAENMLQERNKWDENIGIEITAARLEIFRNFKSFLWFRYICAAARGKSWAEI